MIIECHRRESLNAPLDYNIKKLDKCHANIIARRFIPNDASPDELEEILKANAEGRRVKKPFFHINLNPSPTDWERGLTVEQMAEMCKEAADKLFPGCPWIAFHHFDISRHHAHIVGCAIKRDGTLVSDRFEWNRCMAISRNLELSYGLECALDQTEEKRASRAEPIKYEDGDLSRKIGDILALAMTYRCSRLGELNAFLNLYNCGFDQVDNDKKRGLSYYVLKDGQRVGRAIIATKIRCGALASIEKHLKNASITESDLSKLQFKIEHAIRNAISIEGVKQNLERMQVRTVERIDPEGKVLGVTFVDDENKVIANGSNIGREYSYANIMKRFQTNEPTQEITYEEVVQERTADSFGQCPDIVPNLAGLLHVGPAVGANNVNKRKKRWKFW